MRSTEPRSFIQRSVLSLAAAVCAVGLFAAPASAQEILVALQAYAGRDTPPSLATLGSTTGAPVSKGECDAMALLDFRFTAIDSSRSQLRFFHGSNCEMSSVRNDTTDTSCTQLTPEYSIDMNTQVDRQIAISDLIDCTATGSGTRTIFVLALDNETSEVSGAGQMTSFPIAFDFEGPSAPTDLMTRDGQSDMTLTWAASTDQIENYEVFFIADGCDASGNVTTDRLSDPDNLSDSDIIEDMVPGASSTAEVAFPSGTAIGTHHAVAIRAIDNTGNVGALSMVTCVSTISVTTWFDEYCSGASAPAACNSAGCSAAPRGAPSGSGLFIGLIGLLGLVWRTRR